MIFIRPIPYELCAIILGCPNTGLILLFHVVRLLAEIVDKNKNMVWNIHNHDSLLENKVHNHPT